MTRLQAAIVAMALVFGTILYLLVVIPVMDSLTATFAGVDAIGEEEISQMDRVEMIAVRIVPALIVIGVIFFAYLAVSRKQRRRGRI